jgi:1-deoxy-D-xylulose-5-phosphate reductoisomerase
VHAFLAGLLPFLGIAEVVEECLQRLPTTPVRAFESLYEADHAARALAGELVRSSD